jgi:hypothetical protein
MLAHTILRWSLCLLAVGVWFYFVVRTIRAVANHATSLLSTAPLLGLVGALWVIGAGVLLGEAAAIVFAFVLVAVVAALIAYWFPSIRIYCISLSLSSTLFALLFATGLWRPFGNSLEYLWSNAPVPTGGGNDL